MQGTQYIIYSKMIILYLYGSNEAILSSYIYPIIAISLDIILHIILKSETGFEYYSPAISTATTQIEVVSIKALNLYLRANASVGANPTLFLLCSAAARGLAAPEVQRGLLPAEPGASPGEGGLPPPPAGRGRSGRLLPRDGARSPAPPAPRGPQPGPDVPHEGPGGHPGGQTPHPVPRLFGMRDGRHHPMGDCLGILDRLYNR